MSRRKLCAVGALLVVSLVAFVGCQKGSGLMLGAEIPKQTPVKLEQIVNNQQEYNGKQVVLKGLISGQCPSLCEFFYKEGAHTATIFPQGFKLPKLETGKQVTVYAQVTSGSERVVISALGISTN